MSMLSCVMCTSSVSTLLSYQPDSTKPNDSKQVKTNAYVWPFRKCKKPNLPHIRNYESEHPNDT